MESNGTPPRRTEVLSEPLRKYVRRGARANVSKLLGRLRPQDTALALRGLTPADRHEVFQVLSQDHPDRAAEVLTEMEPAQRLALLERLSAEEIAALLERIPVDDAVFVVESLPAGVQDRVLALVDLRDLADVQAQLTYRDDTAGRMMATEFFALDEKVTVREAIAAIQEQRDVEMIFYLYVVDHDGHLVGVTSLRQLLLSPPERALGEIMSRSVIKVHTDTDQEEVAQLTARYDLLAIPVTDDGNRLVGIVTVDDVIDVVKEEAAEDLFKLAGTSEDELLYQERPLRVARLRLPSLLVALAGLMATGLMLQHFQVELQQAIFLLAFVPVIMGMGGIIGGQASAVVVRGLTSGRLEAGGRSFGAFLWQQSKVGALVGLACALVVGAGAALLQENPFYGVVVGTSLLCAVVVASLNGALVPMLFQKAGIDPAKASGPLLSTTHDITGILIYFGLAGLLIDRLVR